MNETGNRIWRPSVEPNANPVPFPTSATNGTIQQQRVYTKTSLLANQDNQSTNYNRAILQASQSYNSSPKPFRRQEQVSDAPSVASLPTVSFTGSNRQPTIRLQQVDQLRREFSSSTQKLNEFDTTPKPFKRAESMSPKLVHKQYNSPLDLYSMNNIRKTIEAHTELIAPGVKGINFMKGDTPINKQSEVYRLVKEEEEQRASSRLSPISGQPLKLPIGLQQQQQHGMAESMVTGEQSRSSFAKQQSSTSECSWANRQQSTTSRSGCPACCECGHSIVGPFAKIGNRFVHPHCFNCATCGTSLKNTGYFTIEEKLYCEIHAKQVANMMRIPFNFDTTTASQQQQQQQSNLSTMSATQTVDQSAQSRLESLDHSAHNCQSQAAGLQQGQTNNTVRPQVSFGSPATISTMFANRSQSQAGAGQGDQKYSRAASFNEQVASSNGHHKLDGQQITEAASVNGRLFSGQQSMVSSTNTTQDRRFIQESCQVALGGRLPVCVNCQAQIHGPYILASQTTWCKHCSQNHFNCSSCNRSLLDIGFIEDGSHRYYCEHCYEAYCAPVCSKCNIKIKGDCLNALNKKWHPSCFTCGHCRRPFGNSSFYLEDNVPYCERDWRALFTTKCYSCSYPIEAGDKWIEALGRNYHSNCFRCTSCQANLEGSTFYRKGDKPYCRLHAR